MRSRGSLVRAEGVVVLPLNAVYHRVETEPGIAREISDHFTFEVPGARFTPAFKRGGWDGTIKLFKKGLLYAGLLSKLMAFCEERGHGVTLHNEIFFEEVPWWEDLNLEWLGLPATYEPRDYQLKAYDHAYRKGRALFLSPTASGKSLIIYALARTHERTLIIVPTVNLVKQMIGDFRDYGYEGEVHGIQAGESRNTDAPIVVSTWQSIAREEPEWVQQFKCVIVDEAHLAKAKTICGIMEAATNVKYRFGFTGTLDGTPTNEMVLEGLFGPIVRVTTTKALMDSGTIARVKIKVITLRHPERIRKQAKAAQYADEIKYLISSEARNKFIANLVSELRGNTLVLYTRVEQHGAILADMLTERLGADRVHFVHGGVDADDREEVRRIIQESDDAVAVASYGVYQLGVNAPRLNNVVFASPYKSRIVVAQSIGRGLRMSEGKTECDVYDVADDLSHGRWRNHTLRHSYERVKLYASEGMDYSVFTVDLPDTGARLDLEALDAAQHK